MPRFRIWPPRRMLATCGCARPRYLDASKICASDGRKFGLLPKEYVIGFPSALHLPIPAALSAKAARILKRPSAKSSARVTGVCRSARCSRCFSVRGQQGEVACETLAVHKHTERGKGVVRRGGVAKWRQRKIARRTSAAAPDSGKIHKTPVRRLRCRKDPNDTSPVSAPRSFSAVATPTVFKTLA